MKNLEFCTTSVESLPESEQQQNTKLVVLGPFPQRLKCSHCTKFIRTTIVATPRPLSSFGAVIMYFCCLWPLFLIPYCFNSCYQVAHFCPCCGNYIGCYLP